MAGKVIELVADRSDKVLPSKPFQGLLSEIADFVGTITRCGEGLEDPKCSPKTNEEIASVTLKMFRVLKKLAEVGNSDTSIHIVLDSLIELTSEKRTPKQVWSLKALCLVGQAKS